jgi:large subunit ribosomal protein L10
LPTDRKIQNVEQLSQLLSECTIAISADFTRMPVTAMTDLRRALRQQDVQFRVIKNRLVYLAADAAGKPQVKDIVEGPTGLALGYGDPVEPAKALVEYIRSTRSPMRIRGGVLGDRPLSAEEVGDLAALPSRDALLARLLGQLQGPAAGLTYVLSAPISGLVRVLQRRVESLEEQQGNNSSGGAEE